MKLHHILFDLDNTLYRFSCGLYQEISRRMTAFVARFCGLEEEEAGIRREEYRIRYGTTLGGLLYSDGLEDPEDFIRHVHPHDVESYIDPDPALRPMLAGIDIPKSIFTNSPREHAERVLDYFGIKDCFRGIFDIRFSQFAGKPHVQSYRNVLSVLKHPPEHVLFIDDSGSYLEGYRRLGGPVLQIRENGMTSGDWPCLTEIKELPRFLSSQSII